MLWWVYVYGNTSIIDGLESQRLTENPVAEKLHTLTGASLMNLGGGSAFSWAAAVFLLQVG
nr:hypothetical protein [Pseudomonas mucidolens]